MADQKFYGQSGTYTLAGEIGKGGEGQVYAVAEDPGLVLKLYTEDLPPDKIRKLRLMASTGDDKIKDYAAWPLDVVSDHEGKVSGFVMRKLVNYVPIHMLFSPMDRKKMFPDKGYNFLVRVAGNLARAFHAIHASDLVIGDVNEGNVLVNSKGMVAFIDCDSFQVKGDGGRGTHGERLEYFFCEVGVPRYTPPELLVKTSFGQVVRTGNTDVFSMSILIFQLLFLGRHPFAGKNMSAEEIDEEKAIKQHLFAYSLTASTRKLSPPDNTFNIQNLSAGLSELFHRSFEQTENRPLPAVWIKELDQFEKLMVSCQASKVHVYPSTVAHCPWCEFKERKNILFFLDDAHLQQMGAINDIEKFINGFRIENIKHTPLIFPAHSNKEIKPSHVDVDFHENKRLRNIYIAGTLVLSILLACVNIGLLFPGLLVSFALYFLMPSEKIFTAELQKRNTEYLLSKKQLQSAITEYNSQSDYLSYRNAAAQMEKLITRYRNLPSELMNKTKAAEEKLYHSQVHQFLSTIYIAQATIPSIGPTRKTALDAAKIITASDVSKLHNIKVQGIGPAAAQILFSWQRQVASNFVYLPNKYLLDNEMRTAREEIERTKKSLEHEIKKEYQSLQYTRVILEEKRAKILSQIDELTDRYFQAKADYEILQSK